MNGPEIIFGCHSYISSCLANIFDNLFQIGTSLICQILVELSWPKTTKVFTQKGNFGYFCIFELGWTWALPEVQNDPGSLSFMSMSTNDINHKISQT